MNNRYRNAHITGSGLIPSASQFSGPGEFIPNITDGTNFTIDYAGTVIQMGNQAIPQVSASYAVTASNATTASYALNGGTGGTGVSASYASTASMVNTVVIPTTGSFTASINDAVYIVNAGAGSASIYLPSAAARRGQTIVVYKIDSSVNPVIVDAAGSDLIDGNPGRQFTVQSDGASFTSDGGTFWISDGASTGLVPQATASYALVAQNVLGSIASAISASYALTASFALRAASASVATSASWAPGSTTAISASYALTASYVSNGGSGGGGTPATASYALTIPYQANHSFNNGQHVIEGWATANTITVIGITAPTMQGNPAYVNPPTFSSTLVNGYQRVQCTSTGAASSSAGYVDSKATYVRGNLAGRGGFSASAIFRQENIASNTAQIFCGLSNVTNATICNSQFNSKNTFHIIGFGKDTADTNWQVVSCDGAGNLTKADTGVAVSTSAAYQMDLFCAQNDSQVFCTLTNLSTATVVFSGAVTATLPSATVYMSLHLENGTPSVSSTVMTVMGFYTVQGV